MVDKNKNKKKYRYNIAAAFHSCILQLDEPASNVLLYHQGWGDKKFRQLRSKVLPNEVPHCASLFLLAA